MTTASHREQTKSFDAERTGTQIAARAGAVARGQLPSLVEATLERAADLFLAGYWAESRALVRREIEGRS
jgi:hypothetical protein